MKTFAAIVMFVLAAATPDPQYFRYERPVHGLPARSGQTCLVVDAGVFAHAAPGLADLRLYRNSGESAYVVHLATPIQSAEQALPPLNLGARGGHTVFDAVMPAGKYSDLTLDVTGENFIATVNVSGSQLQGGAETKLGDYTVFDLSRQRLGRSTVLHLPESDFPYLHFQIGGPLAPESITGLSVERLPTSQPRYQTVAGSSHSVRKGRTSVFEFTVAVHVPVDRVVFKPGPETAMFSRDVTIAATPNATRPLPNATDAPEPPQPAISSGNILRLHTVQDGHRIDEERLVVDAPMAGFDAPATATATTAASTTWTVTVENGDDAPLTMESVELQMVERNLCFEAAADGHYTLFYGDPALSAPSYDYATLFRPQTDAARATVGPEQENSAYRPRADERPFTEKHPALLWAALIAVIALLGGIAVRSADRSKDDRSKPAAG